MITTEFNGGHVLAHPEFGRVLLTEVRGEMAVVRTERVVYIQSVREPHPHVDLPADCEPEGA